MSPSFLVTARDVRQALEIFMLDSGAMCRPSRMHETRRAPAQSAPRRSVGIC